MIPPLNSKLGNNLPKKLNREILNRIKIALREIIKMLDEAGFFIKKQSGAVEKMEEEEQYQVAEEKQMPP